VRFSDDLVSTKPRRVEEHLIHVDDLPLSAGDEDAVEASLEDGAVAFFAGAQGLRRRSQPLLCRLASEISRETESTQGTPLNSIRDADINPQSVVPFFA